MGFRVYKKTLPVTDPKKQSPIESKSPQTVQVHVQRCQSLETISAEKSSKARCRLCNPCMAIAGNSNNPCSFLAMAIFFGCTPPLFCQRSARGQKNTNAACTSSSPVSWLWERPRTLKSVSWHNSAGMAPERKTDHNIAKECLTSELWRWALRGTRVCGSYITLANPLQLQPWSQDRRNSQMITWFV